MADSLAAVGTGEKPAGYGWCNFSERTEFEDDSLYHAARASGSTAARTQDGRRPARMLEGCGATTLTAMDERMRIGFTSDLHGRDLLYTQIDSLLRIEPVDLLILGGDLFPDGVQSDPGSQLPYIQKTFLPTVAAWRKRHHGLQVACILGNHDWRKTEYALLDAHKAGELALLRPQSAWTHSGVAFVGFSFTPPSPHWLKDFERLDQAQDPVPDFPGWVSGDGNVAREVSANDHFSRLPSLEQELATIARPKDPWILVCHSPPFGGRLDRLPSIDRPLGSRSVGKFISATKPLCALHGHIHEAPEVTGYFRDTVDGVACINPGQVGDRLHAVLFDVERPIESLKHTVFG